MIMTSIITDISDSTILQSQSQSQIIDTNNTNDKNLSKKQATSKRKGHEITKALSSPRPKKKRKKTHNNLGNTRVSTSSFDKPNAIKTNQMNIGLSNDQVEIIFGENYHKHKHVVLEYPKDQSIYDMIYLLTQNRFDRNNDGLLNCVILQNETIQSILNGDDERFNLTKSGLDVYRDQASKLGIFEFRVDIKNIVSKPKRFIFESLNLFNDHREEVKKYENKQFIICHQWSTSNTMELLDIKNLFSDEPNKLKSIGLVFIYLLCIMYYFY